MKRIAHAFGIALGAAALLTTAAAGAAPSKGDTGGKGGTGPETSTQSGAEGTASTPATEVDTSQLQFRSRSGANPDEAERYAAHHGEHAFYEFAFGRFKFQGLYQKFWQPFEVRHRLAKAGFRSVALEQLLYPWDESLACGPEFAEQPKSGDWSFTARP